MDNKDYLNSIHSKIRTKQKRNNFIGSVGALSVCLIVFFYAPTIEADMLFDDFYDSMTYYEWEIINEPSSDEILD